MIDPRSLGNRNLPSFEPDAIGDLGEYDRDEPLVLEGLALDMAALRHLAGVPIALDGCRITSCDLSPIQLCGVKHSLIVDSKLRGTVFAKYLRNMVFDSCQLAECAMRMLQLQDVVFDSCQITSCDFYGSDLARVGFPKSSVAGVGFDQCTIDDVDLTEAADLQIGDPRTLRGAALRETQVPLIALRLAELSGITIHDG